MIGSHSAEHTFDEKTTVEHTWRMVCMYSNQISTDSLGPVGDQRSVVGKHELQNREYLAPQIRSMNYRFHSEANYLGHMTTL